MGKSPAACTAWLVATLLLALLVPTGFAHSEDLPAPAAEDPAPGRFTMVPAEGGFVRLDTRTGVVSHCRRETGEPNAAWRCAVIPEDELGRPDRLAELGGQVEALQQEVTTLQEQLSALESADAARRAAETKATVSSDAEMSRALDFSEEMMRRFLGLVREFKRDDTRSGS